MNALSPARYILRLYIYFIILSFFSVTTSATFGKYLPVCKTFVCWTFAPNTGKYIVVLSVVHWTCPAHSTYIPYWNICSPDEIFIFDTV